MGTERQMIEEKEREGEKEMYGRRRGRKLPRSAVPSGWLKRKQDVLTNYIDMAPRRI